MITFERYDQISVKVTTSTYPEMHPISTTFYKHGAQFYGHISIGGSDDWEQIATYCFPEGADLAFLRSIYPIPADIVSCRLEGDRYTI